MHLGGKFERIVRVLIAAAVFLTTYSPLISTVQAGDGDLSVPSGNQKLPVSTQASSANPDDLASLS